MIKRLLRKIFFWDEPAKGAFFGLTLMLFLIWCGVSLFCACLVIHSRIFWFDGAPFLLLAFVVLPSLYILFLVSKELVNMARRTPQFWKRLLKMLSATAVLTLFCAFITFGLLPVGQGNSIVALALWFALGLAILGTGYLFRPIVHPAKLSSCLLGWLGSFLVFSTLLLYANPFTVRRYAPFSHAPWLGDSIPYVKAFWHWFELNGNGCFWFTLAGFVMVAVAYVLSWNIFAKLSGRTMRQFCGKGICFQWIIMAGCYVVTLLFALWNTSQYHKAMQELETHYGHSMTGAELGRLYYNGRTPDPDYWKKVESSVEQYYRQYEDEMKKIVSYDYRFETHRYTVLPKELYEKRRNLFQTYVASVRLDELYGSPLPPNQRDYANSFLLGMEHPELSNIRQLARIEERRCDYAIDSGDFKTAAETIAHVDVLCDYLSKDHYNISYFVWNAIDIIHDGMLAKILESGLASDEWLEEQANLLQWREKRYVQRERMFLYSETVVMLDAFRRTVDCDYHVAYQAEVGYMIKYSPLRFFFPQGWWLAAKSMRVFARVMKIDSSDQLPKRAIGNVLVDMFCPDTHVGEKIRGNTAHHRVLRGLIAAELQKRRTGSYPDAMEGLPVDPFTNLPLKYCKGACPITRYQVKWLPEKEWETLGDDERFANVVGGPDGGYWKFEPKEETIEAIQIWSVGPDGVDDAFVSRKGDDDSGGRRPDDIRFIIPINQNHSN